MSGVKVGDRVRATCGESVIVGTVQHMYPHRILVDVDGVNVTGFHVSYSCWSVEALAPPVIVAVGTIVRDKNGDAWQRRPFGWYLADQDDRLYSLMDLPRLAPLTVLWTPDVEATP